MLKELWAARDALNYGEKLANSATWKDRTTLGNVVSGIVVTGAVFVPQLREIEPLVLQEYGRYIGWAAFSVFNIYNTIINVTTSDTVGFKKNG